MPRLIASTGHSLELPPRHLTFGESPHCSIPMAAGNGLAPLHFELAPAADGSMWLRDASGGEGTMVNGLPVTITALKEGDVIQAGQLILTFSNDEDPGSPSHGSETAGPAMATPIPAADDPVAPTPPAAETSLKTSGPPAGILQPEPEPTAQPPQLPLQPSPQSTKTAPVPAPLTFPRAGRHNAASPGRRTSPHLIRMVSIFLIIAAAGVFLATDPGQRLIRPLIAKINEWNTSRPAKSTNLPTAPPVAGGNTVAGSQDASSSAETPPTSQIIPQTSHAEITRRLLTPRTQTYLYADLRQLIPSYNFMASQQGLPSQRELSESFRRTYGAVIDSFGQLAFLQSDTPGEFLMILTSQAKVDLEKIIGQPARPSPEGQSTSRIYPIRSGSQPLSAALYDPFTLLIGSPRPVELATKASAQPPIREARALFPETAHRQPGALILVTRVNQTTPGTEGEPAIAFESIVTNLFLGDTPSTLTLIRNPDVKEEAFVDAAGPALKEQAAALAPALGTAAANLPNLPPGEIRLTTNEASINLPGGPALINSALESLARRLNRQAPAIKHILKAQDAVMRFNSARATASTPAMEVTTPREALDLLDQGIRGGGALSGATFQLSIAESEMDNLASLLALDPAIGLIYRPDPQTLAGPSLELALKARDYRNAELLIALWLQARFEASPEETATSAVRRVLEWAATPEGQPQRTVLGLPSLEATELDGALAHLAISSGTLTWKPEGTDYRTWVRQVNPDPYRDASRLAATYNAAVAAGAIPPSAQKDVPTAINLITRGVAGRGDKADQTFKLDSLTPEELKAAMPLLSLDNGEMEATPAAPATE